MELAQDYADENDEIFFLRWIIENDRETIPPNQEAIQMDEQDVIHIDEQNILAIN